MRFHEKVVKTTLADIPVVGNLDNGQVVGLDAAGDALCGSLLAGDVPEEDALSCNELLVRHLEQQGFFRRAEDSMAISHAYVHVTQRCNLACEGCYSFDAGRNKAADPSLENLRCALMKLARAGVSRVVLSGGEPFMHADLPEIIRYAKQDCGIARVEVLTNGTCISDACIQQIAGHADYISISLDIPAPDEESAVRKFDRLSVLLDAVKRLQAAGVPVGIKATMHRKNAGDLERYVALAKELGCGVDFSLLTCPPGGCDADVLPDDEALGILARSLIALNKEDMVNEIRRGAIGVRVKESCKAAVGLVSVAYDGEVYPCHMLHREGLSMGNLFRDGVDVIEASLVRKALAGFTVDTLEDCAGCSYKWFCGGGCQARTFDGSNADERRRDDYCVLMKEYNGSYESLLKETLFA